MKKQILSFALVATMIGAIATGCSSAKETSGSDTTGTTKSDSSGMMSTPAKDSLGMKKDTIKGDTTKKTPMMTNPK